MHLFIELSLVIVLAMIIASVMKVLRQPLIVGYILTGIIVGPYALNFFQATENIQLFSELKIAILLFIVGLSLNPLVFKEVGKTSLFTGIGQVLFTTLFGFVLMELLGFDTLTSLYVGLALSFSSTIIVLKILTDKGDLNKLYGRVSIGFLLVQDVIAIIVLLLVSTIPRVTGESVSAAFALLFLKGFAYTALIYIIGKRVLPEISRFFASSQELLFLFSLAWGLGLASLFYSVGFSIEVGALIAGVLLSVSPFSHEISSRIKPLRDFFVLLFFIMFGTQIIVTELSTLILPALILSGLILIGNPLIIFVIMNLLGYKRKTSIMAGFTVAQISEFSLILISMAFAVGHVSAYIVSLITLVCIITICGSTYLMLFADKIYPKIPRLLGILEFKKTRNANYVAPEKHHEVIIFGYDRVGTDFVHAAETLKKKFVVVDFNPRSIQRLKDNNIPNEYGDAEDVDFLQDLGIQNAELVISTLPDFSANMVLVQIYRKDNQKGVIIVLSHDVNHAKALYDAGATYVVMPHYLGAHYASSMIERFGVNQVEFETERNKHLTHLLQRRSI